MAEQQVFCECGASFASWDAWAEHRGGKSYHRRVGSPPRPLGHYPGGNLAPGIYRIFWKDGGVSLAAVGVSSNGDNWIAPCNWLEPLKSVEACYPAHPEHWSWASVERAELLMKASEATDGR